MTKPKPPILRKKRVAEALSAQNPKQSTLTDLDEKQPQTPTEQTTARPAPEQKYFDSAFLDNLAHQLVTPLQSIENHCVNIIQGRIPGDKINVRLGEVVGHVRVMIALANRIRFLHQMVAMEESPVTLVSMPFNEVVTQFIDSFNNYLPECQSRGMSVDIRTEDMNNLPRVLGAELANHQVIMNLYDNAIKYSDPKARITISGEAKGEFVEVSFRHPGVKIKEEEREKIFERGYRGEGAKSRRAGGTGVGLWVSRKLMRAMKGDMSVVPAGRNGETEFRVRWRRA